MMMKLKKEGYIISSCIYKEKEEIKMEKKKTV